MKWRGAAPQYGGLAAALVLGALCRLWNLTGPSLFIDEGFVFHASQGTPAQILTTVAYTDFHPPLFYLVTHYLVTWLHWPLWDYRYLTAGLSLAGIAATWGVGRRCFGTGAASIAAVALALAPALIEWDRLYRMYSVLVALTAISWWLLLRACDARKGARVAWWVAYGCAAIVLPYVHYVGALIVLSQGVYATSRLRTCWPALALDALAAIALVPWAWAIAVQYPHGGLVASIHSPAFSWMSVVRATLTEGLPGAWLLQPGFDLSVGLVALAVLACGLIVARSSVLPYWVGPIVLQVVASFALGKDLVIPRYLFAYVPAFCLALGVLCAHLFVTRYRLVAALVTAAYLGLAATGIPNMLFVPYYQFPDWYQVNALVLANERAGDLVALDQGAEYWIVHDFSAFRGHDIEAPALPSDIDTTIRWIERYPRRRVWYIENQPGFTDPSRRLERYLNATRHALSVWRQERVYKEDSVLIVLYGPRLTPAGKKSVVTTTSP